ncbi:MAG: ATP-binding cassette domain-containing protein, partial [Kiritimatiellae bacterium]|nr:ATP-binding cassette domain-containing protein [Kiritimatiellia bacterium]
VNGQTRHIYAYLQDFLFTPERARTPACVLSGGERSRLLLARHFLAPGNLLAMDEPTNDLDIETLDLLEEQLDLFGGTLLLVSHDRAFLNNVVTSTLALEGHGRVGLYAGGYDDWLRQRAPASASRPAPEQRSPTPPAIAPRATAKRLGFNEKRELAGIGERIESLEREQRELHAQLSHPEHYRKSPAEIADRQKRADELHHEIERLVERWAELETLNAG